jgi:hypothetical protein
MRRSEFIPESRAPRALRPDPVGQVLVITALASVTYAIIEGPGSGWASAKILGLFTLAAVAFAGLICYELHHDEPLIEMRCFRSAQFSGATLTAVCAFAALGGFLFLNTLYLQDVRGFSALHAGLYLLPMAAMIVVFAPLSGRRYPGAAAADGGGRHRDRGQRDHADPADRWHPGGLAHRVLPGAFWPAP